MLLLLLWNLKVGAGVGTVERAPSPLLADGMPASRTIRTGFPGPVLTFQLILLFSQIEIMIQILMKNKEVTIAAYLGLKLKYPGLEIDKTDLVQEYLEMRKPRLKFYQCEVIVVAV